MSYRGYRGDEIKMFIEGGKSKKTAQNLRV